MPPINGLRNSSEAHKSYKYFVPTGLTKAQLSLIGGGLLLQIVCRNSIRGPSVCATCYPDTSVLTSLPSLIIDRCAC